MDGYIKKTKIVKLNPDETLDDIFEKIRTMAELPFAIHSVTIFKDSVRFEYWDNDNVLLNASITCWSVGSSQ